MVEDELKTADLCICGVVQNRLKPWCAQLENGIRMIVLQSYFGVAGAAEGFFAGALCLGPAGLATGAFLAGTLGATLLAGAFLAGGGGGGGGGSAISRTEISVDGARRPSAATASTRNPKSPGGNGAMVNWNNPLVPERVSANICSGFGICRRNRKTRACG
jgi:hypothetical protein